jgi:hypothetical protein
MGVSVDHSEETRSSLVLALIEHVDVRFLARLASNPKNFMTAANRARTRSTRDCPLASVTRRIGSLTFNMMIFGTLPRILSETLRNIIETYQQQGLTVRNGIKWKRGTDNVMERITGVK